MSEKLRTDELRPGMRVRLCGGPVRTVDEVVDSGWLNRRNETIYAVRWAEGDTNEWSGANGGIAETLWNLEPTCIVLVGDETAPMGWRDCAAPAQPIGDGEAVCTDHAA